MTGKNTRSASNKQEDIAAKMEDLEARFQQGIDRLRTEYHNSKPASEINVVSFESKLEEFEAVMQKSLESIRMDIKNLRAELDDCKKKDVNRVRIGNFNKLVIRELPEKDSAMLVEEVCNLINNHIKVRCQKSDIKCCYRLGKKLRDARERKCRPVVVEFVCQWKRDEVFFQKKNLKGSGFLISEMLTSDRFNLFLKVRRECEGNSVWTARGNIVVSINNVKYHINTEEDLLRIKK